MARLIHPGGFDAPEEPHPAPAGGFTRAYVRRLVGTPTVAIPGPGGLTVFGREYTTATRREDEPDPPNLRASALCGRLLAGPALVVGPADPVSWE